MTGGGTAECDAVSIVTGGTQGIGLATVTALAARGGHVVALSRRQDHIDALASLPFELAARVSGFPADVRDEASVAAAVERIAEDFGRIDVLVNCAGVSMSARRRFAETSAQEWTRLIEANLNGTYFMTRAVIPHLEEHGGYIINVLSTAAFAARPGVSIYAASKFGARALTEALIEEYRGSGIRVSSVSPGAVDTTIWTHKENPPSAEERARMMRPGDVAETILWLLDRPRRLHVPDITITPWASD